MKNVVVIFGVSMLVSSVACTPTSQQFGTTKTVVVRETVNELEKEPVPGTVHDVWVEQMADTVRVPAQLDPKGVYYIPSHRTIVEIRHGKYQKVQYPDYNGKYRQPRTQ